jgi:hypothetical protein
VPVGKFAKRSTSITALQTRRARGILSGEVISVVNGSQMEWEKKEEKIVGGGRHLLRRFFFLRVGGSYRLPFVGPFIALQANMV